MQMKATDFASVFAALTDENDDFSYLVKKYKLDPTRDFVGADLSNVNFGAFSVEILNLKDANLIGADLSLIKCKKLITDSAELKDTKLPPQHVRKNVHEQTDSALISEIKGRAILAIHSYLEKEPSKRNTAERIFDSGAPEYVEYFTRSEKIEIEKRIITAAQQFSKAVQRTTRSNRKKNFKIQKGWKSKVIKFHYDFDRTQLYRQLNGDELDRYFLGKLADSIHLDSGSVDDLQPIFTKHLPDYESMKRDLAVLKSSTENTSIKRAAFKHIIQSLCRSCDHVTMIFVDFLPFSKILYHQLNRDIKTYIKFIFIGPYVAESSQAASMVSSEHFVYGYVPERRKFAETDLSKIVKRISLATNGKLLFSNALSKDIKSLVGLEINIAIPRISALVADAIKKVERKISSKLNRRGQLYIY